jgi:AcrR family transcriptional regulator
MLGKFAATRRRRHRAEVVGVILDVARAVMREQGVAALNLNEVARRVGMRTPSLYEYFDGKMALYDALFALGVRLFRECMGAVFAADLAPGARLRVAIETYMRFAQEHPDLYQLIFERPVPGFEPSGASLAESLAALEEGTRAVEAMVASGAVAPAIPVEQARDLIIAVMHGLTAQHLANEPHLPVGAGRFGSLVPAAAALFEAAWAPAPKTDKEGNP